nr:MAG TPA: hypothetical protein [Caudoviricetes sp.]
MRLRTQISVKLPESFNDSTILHRLRDACLKRMADNQLYRRQAFVRGRVSITFGDLRGFEKRKDLPSECILYRQALKECFKCEFSMEVPHKIDYKYRDRVIFEIVLQGEPKA